jgi:paraquat-inducible protein B
MKSNRFALIGAFIIGALCIGAVAFALFFGGSFGKSKSRAVMVFRGNVTGLEVGTPVQFRGMKIGEVKRVRTIYNPVDRQVLFPVYAEFTGTIEVPGYEKSSDAPGVRDAWLSGMVQRGLRASLQTKSFVTGQQMIMLDFEEVKPPVFAKIEPTLLEIPTTISPNESLVETFKELPVREMVIEGRQMLNNINQLMVDAQGKPGPLPMVLKQIAELSQTIEAKIPTLSNEILLTTKETRATLVSARGAINSLAQTSTMIGARTEKLGNTLELGVKDFSSLTGRVQDSLNAFDKTLAKAENSMLRIDQSLAVLDRGIGSTENTLGKIEFALSDDSAIGYGLAKSLEEVSAAAKALRQTVEAIKRKPNSLLIGNSANAN